MFPLHAQMNNGATVSDWLGTAESAAAKARRLMEAVRTEYQGRTYGVRVDASPRVALAVAEGALLDALSELRAITSEVDRLAVLS